MGHRTLRRYALNHWYYVALAYGAFTLLLCWDFVMPRLALKKTARALALRLRRKKPL